MCKAKGSRVRVFAVRAIGRVVLLGSGWTGPNFARAEDELQQARIAAEQVWYERYCMPCHGPGGAPGSAVFTDSKQPVDLRTYVQRHGGKFPAGQWLAVVFDRDPRMPHSGVWEKIKSDRPAGTCSKTEARGIVAMIADYILSVQQKQSALSGTSRNIGRAQAAR
jgi:hypothetical protein